MTAALATMARQLGGDVVGFQVLCPGPGHSRKDRSLSVRLSPTAPEGFVVYSHAGDDLGICRDHVRALMGWERPSWRRDRSSVTPAKPQSGPAPDEAAKIARATAIWREARDPRGTVVERYLASRGLVLPTHVAGEVLRYHPACPWRDADSGTTLRVPAMVAALTSMTTGEVAGIHRTRLTLDGRKVDRRMLGRAAGAAIMLSPYDTVEAGLAIGEGIETCLAAHRIGWTCVWATGSAGGIGRFPLLPGLQSLVLLAETGDGGANARAIEAVGERYASEGREVLIVEPRYGDDINDALLGAA